MRRMLALLLCCLTLCGGCRGTKVVIMGVDTDRWVNASDLSKEEKRHAAVILGVAIGASVVAIAAN